MTAMPTDASFVDCGDHYVCRVGKGEYTRYVLCGRLLEYSKERKAVMHKCPPAVLAAMEAAQHRAENEEDPASDVLPARAGRQKSFSERIADGFNRWRGRE